MKFSASIGAISLKPKPSGLLVGEIRLAVQVKDANKIAELMGQEVSVEIASRQLVFGEKSAPTLVVAAAAKKSKKK